MKKILYAVMLLLGMSILSSCSKEQNYSKLIIGKWEWTFTEYIRDGKVVDSEEEGGSFYVFNSDGSVEYYSGERRIGMAQYSITGNKLFLGGYALTIQKLTSDELVAETPSFSEIYDTERRYFKKVK